MFSEWYESLSLREWILVNRFYIIGAVILTLLLFRYFRPQIKGFRGEQRVRRRLRRLNKNEYKVINNLKLFYNGIVAQIDHLVVSTYGIFVIETKNYTGWIFGSEGGREWTQVIYHSQTKFYNPLKQNIGHIRAIRGNLTQYSNIHYYPIVVFCGDSELKVNSSYPVIKPKNLLKTIKQVQKNHISIELRDEIYFALLRLNGNQPQITPKLYDEKVVFHKVCK